MTCAENSTLCPLLVDAGSGIGEFGNALLSGGGFIKLIMTLAIMTGIVGLVFAVVALIRGYVHTKPGKSY